MIDLATMKPTDKTAAMVTGKSSEYNSNYLKKKSNAAFTTGLPVPMRKFVSTRTRKGEWTIDLTGKKYGKITVLGLYRENNRWVVECECGNRELRTTKAVKRESKIDMCESCQDLKNKRTRGFYILNGFYPDEMEGREK